MSRALVLAGLVCASLAAASAHAEQMKRFGEFEVHYSAMPTDALVPEVARQYGIERSAKRGLLTLTVLRRDRDGRAMPVKAALSAELKLLTGQASVIPLREIASGGALYYLGEFRVMPPQTVRIVVAGSADGAPPLRFDFSRDFY